MDNGISKSWSGWDRRQGRWTRRKRGRTRYGCRTNDVVQHPRIVRDAARVVAVVATSGSVEAWKRGCEVVGELDYWRRWWRSLPKLAVVTFGKAEAGTE